MKKRILSMLLAVVMVLSLATTTVLAAETENTTYPTVHNMNGLDITVDGIKNAEEGWDNVHVFDFDKHVYDGTGKDAIDRNDRVDSITGESNIRYSHDDENIYVYYETSNSDTLLQEEDNGGLLLRIVPELGVDMRGAENTYTDGTYFFIWLNLRNSLEFTNEDTVGSIWDLIFTDNNHNVWGLGQKTLVAQFGFKGWYDDYGHYSSAFAKNSLIALHVEKDANGTPIKKSIEMKLPMSDLYKQRIAANQAKGTNDPIFYFVAYERTRQYNGTFEAPIKGDIDPSTGFEEVIDTGTSNGGYLVSLDGEPVSWGYDDPGYKVNSRVDYGAPVTFPAHKPEAHTNFGKVVTVDGVMGENEGWSRSPMFVTTINASSNNIQGEATLTQPDTNPTTIRISCDGQKVYFFIESTHYDTLNANWYDCNAGKFDANGSALPADWQTPAYYLHFYPDSDKPRSEYGVDNGHWFTAAFTTFRWYGLSDANLDENGTLIWDMNNPSGNNESLFWRLLYGADRSEQYSKEFCLAGVELAAHVDKNEYGERTKLSIEFAFPLAQEVVAALEEGDVAYKFAFVERTNRYQDMSAEMPTWVTSKDGGYYLNDTMVDSRLKNDEADFGIPITLKQNTYDGGETILPETDLNAAIAAVNKKLDATKTALENAIKAGNKTLTAEIEALGEALVEAEAAYMEADQVTRETLTAKINAAVTTLNAAITAVNQKLDVTKTALENAIKAGNDTLTAEIEALNNAIEEAEAAYAAADLAMSDTLTAKIAAAEATLNAAIAAVDKKLDDAKTELENEIKADNDTVAAEIESLKNMGIAMIVIVSVVCGAGLVTTLILVKKIKLLTSASTKIASSVNSNSSTEN